MVRRIASRVRSNRINSHIPTRSRQRGSVVVMAAIFMALVGIVALGSIDIGYFFSIKRQLRSAADLAALTAVQKVAVDSTCTTATLGAQNVIANAAGANGFPLPSSQQITCGLWTPTNTTGGTFTAASDLPAGTPLNAVQVTLAEPISGFFSSYMPTVSASATARGPKDSFSLTTTLASLNGGVINALLGTLIPGTNLSASVADYQNLASIDLNLAGILAKAGVGGTNEAAGANVSIGELASAEAAVATQQGLTDAQVTAVNDILAVIAKVSGGPSVSVAQLVAVATATTNDAADATVNALSLLTTALQIANGKNFSATTVGVDLTNTPLAGLAQVKATVSASLLSPPSYANGPPGKIGSNYITSANAAEGTVFVDTSVKLLNDPISGSSVASIDLPITLYVAPASAGLDSLTCASSGGVVNKTARITAMTRYISAYIGGSGQATYSVSSGSWASIGTPANIPLVRVGLFGLGLVEIGIIGGQSLTVPGANASGSTYPMTFDAATTIQTVPASGGDLFLSSIVPSILGGGLYVSLAGIQIAIPTSGPIAALLSTVVSGLLTPLLLTVDSTVQQVTALLGLSIGTATVTNTQAAIECGPTLVQ